ncbi:hypothetical protein [Paenibacillus sp. N3.4]|uniref:hypothetical protein n=1 Tax=Paenibacillus sp. N3.4 TaxID=2603222 RepID=UPI0011CA9ADE|nr:hypothetical protein [Paenibacillus sp. N3.4]TXK84391.1 hypothetical protein FU659_09175 [Paenibacillus sp. N3.4]
MQIKKKTDINLILDNFSSVAKWDATGKKLYFVFPDRKRGGKWTLMNYSGNRFSVHGIGTDYADEQELFFNEHDSIVSFLWDHRSAFNASIKEAHVELVGEPS